MNSTSSDQLPFIISGMFIAFVSYKAIKALYNSQTRSNNTTSIIECSEEIEDRLKFIRGCLTKYGRKDKPDVALHEAIARHKILSIDSQLLMTLRKLKNEMRDISRMITNIEEIEDEDEFQSACEFMYQVPPKPNRNELSVTSYEEEFFSPFEEEETQFVDVAWSYINDGLHTEKHKVMWRILVSVNRRNLYYIECAKYFAENPILCRKMRAKQFNCVNDIDFKIKTHALRNAFDHSFENMDTVQWFTNTLRDIFKTLIEIDGRSSDEFVSSFNALVHFCKNPNNFHEIREEIKHRGIDKFTFYDVVFDFCIMDSLDEMESPPAAVKAVLGSRFVPYVVKQKSLSAAISANMSNKKSSLSPDSFMSHFYSFSEHLSLVFGCGLLCSTGSLNECCKIFVEQFQEYSVDIFSSMITSYISFDSLSEEIVNNAKNRLKKINKVLQSHLKLM